MNQLGKQKNLKLPAKRTGDNSSTETNAEKIRRLRPVVEEFSSSFQHQKTLTTDTHSPPKSGVNSTELKAEVDNWKESVKQMKTMHAVEIAAAREDYANLKEELNQKELKNAAEMEKLQENLNEKMKLEMEKKTDEMKTVRDQNYDLKKCINDMKINHAKEMLAKDCAIDELRMRFDEDLKQIRVARNETIGLNEELTLKLEQKATEMQTARARNDDLKKEMNEMKINHADEVQIVKNRGALELQNQLDEFQKQSLAARNEITKLKGELSEKELKHSSEIERLHEQNKKLMLELKERASVSQMESVRNRNERLEKEITELKRMHANEMQTVEKHVTEKLQKEFNEKLNSQAQSMDQPTPTCRSKRSCADCGGRSRHFTIFTYCNPQCKQNYL